MRAEGFEPSSSFEHQDLSLACMPFQHARCAGRIVGAFRPIAVRTCVRMHPESTVSAALALVRLGLSDGAVGRRLGIPRSTVRMWRIGQIPRRGRRQSLCDVCAGNPEKLPTASYCYLLGLYLGDGCISKHPRAYRMRIVLDAKYPNIIRGCADALEAIRPGKVAHVGRKSGCVEVGMYWRHWPCLFPQHGPGRKHLRPIVLAPWQERLVGQEREAFLRGLIHSDGCRIIANDRGNLCVRYHFSNLSEDIKRLYCESLDALGIHWTRPCAKQIAVYRKDDSRALDAFIGPKT